MEYLDYYDANGNFLGSETRDRVHGLGLWHKTVHCWLYDDAGNVYFQLRSESKKMYTTASGHVSAGETLEQAFAREVLEEIGVDVDLKGAEMVEIIAWKMDKKKPDGSVWRDRAFSNAYVNKISEKTTNFVFDPNEVAGLIKIKALDALKILSKEIPAAPAEKITSEKTEPVQISLDDFLINPHEIGLVKYGRILQFIVEKQCEHF